ncbi:hypothetical protein EVAR_44532_1 [Eumeta japonica]|uniref:Uncharacterized protein n=1 Tax=Eumeta variegata TaxID=151549 RepID=A0A4C2A1S4_EUMVA|nr:hypothetical protein EVAR_44532_1 [Eumeta japonica]
MYARERYLGRYTNEPKLDGVALFNYGFLWPPSSSIIRLWLPYSTKVLVKTDQTSPNSIGLRRLITEFLWPPSSSIIRLWLPQGLMMELEGGHRNSVIKRRNPSSLGSFLKYFDTLWYQRLMMELEGGGTM